MVAPAIAQIRRPLIRRAIPLVAGNLVFFLAATAAAAVLAQGLGPEQMGHYQAIVRWTAVLAGLGSLSWGQATMFVMARQEQSGRQLVTNALIASLIQTAVLGLVGYLLAPGIFAEEPAVLALGRMFLLFIPLSLVADYFGHVLRMRLKIRIFNAARVGQSVIFLVSLIGLFATGQGSLSSVVVALLLSYALSSAALVAYVAAHNWLGRPSWTRAVPVLRYGLRIHPGLQARVVNLYLDQLMMAVLLPARALGLYASAVSAALVLQIGSTALLYLAQPEIQRASEGDRASVIGRLLRINLLITVLPGLALIAAMPTLIPLVYGPAFADAILPARLLCIAAIIDGTAVLLGGCLIGLGRGTAVSVVQALSLGASALGLVLFLSDAGIVGAAVISIVSYAVGAVALFAYMRHSLRIGVPAPLLPGSEGK